MPARAGRDLRDDARRRRGPRGRPGGSRRSAGSRCPDGRPRHRGSWSPTPGGSCPATAPVSAMTSADDLEDALRAGRGGQPAAPVGQRRRVERGVGDRQPARGLPPQVERQRLDRLAIRQPVQGLQHQHRGDHLGRHTRAAAGGTGTGRRTTPAGNNRRRCSARNANTLPGSSRCPATDSTSSNSR